MAGFRVDQSSPFEFEPGPVANRGMGLACASHLSRTTLPDYLPNSPKVKARPGNLNASKAIQSVLPAS